jgi:co-chaperonin GroES (HSP10)|tara:strand:+ start:251 stop:661 length:411 start_codon:yes stop_codon:yes gene_type:complete
MGISKTMQLEELEREAAQNISDEEFELQLPKPVGYRILVALPKPEDKFDGTNILKTEKAKQLDHIMSIIGLVVDMGDQAYSDVERFPTGPWCKAGDYVMFRMNSGTRFTIGGIEYRLMNDDSVEAVVADPSGIQRA